MKKRYPFFVYGTLLPDQPNFHYWQNSLSAQMAAQLENGRLFDLGTYPMLIETGTDSVKGRVMHVNSDMYDTILASLDKLEGYAPHAPATSHYRRELRTVTQADSTQIEAWVYIGHEMLTRECAVVPHGDWHTYALQKFSGNSREDLE